jgi:hypothetical protein
VPSQRKNPLGTASGGSKLMAAILTSGLCTRVDVYGYGLRARLPRAATLGSYTVLYGNRLQRASGQSPDPSKA